MTSIKERLRDLFTRPEVEPFVPEEDPFVQRTHEVVEASQERRRQRFESTATIERMMADVVAVNRKHGGKAT